LDTERQGRQGREEETTVSTEREGVICGAVLQSMIVKSSFSLGREGQQGNGERGRGGCREEVSGTGPVEQIDGRKKQEHGK
jgi:hypothetical protein